MTPPVGTDAEAAIVRAAAGGDARAWRCLIEGHSVPDYGDRATPGIGGGPKKQGTHYCHASGSDCTVS